LFTFEAENGFIIVLTTLVNLQTLIEWKSQVMCSYATYSVHCHTLISRLLTKCDDSWDYVGRLSIGQGKTIAKTITYAVINYVPQMST